MATVSPTATATLQLQRRFAAPREKVFRAWTDPDALKRWWVPSAGFSVPHVEVDLRVGGRYRITMQNPKGEQFYLVGCYRDVRPPERLVYTWRWEETHMNIGETLVTVEFHVRGRQTEVTITHELFPDGALRDRHGEGWSGCLDCLPAALELID